MHIGLVLWALYSARGGIERFGIDLSAEMIRRGHRVTIFYAEPGFSDAIPQYPVSPGATCVALPKKRGPGSLQAISMFWPRCFRGMMPCVFQLR